MRAIDADELKELLKEYQAECLKNPIEIMGVLYGGLGAILDVIDQQPTIEPVKLGEWIKIGKHHIQEWQMMNKCSACGHSVTNSSYVDSVVYFKFCPHCGAKMCGDKNESNRC